MVPNRRYDVFISYDRKDGRSRDLGSRVKEGLEAFGVTVFLDDEEIRPGESIEAITKRALSKAKLFIPLMSKSYANSAGTLDELQQIMEIRRIYGHFVIPVDVDLDVEEHRDSHVQWLREWQVDMVLRLESYDFKMNKLSGWREALTETLGLRGMKLKDGKESDIIRKIVEVVKTELERMAKVAHPDLSGNIASGFSKRRRLQARETVDRS